MAKNPVPVLAKFKKLFEKLGTPEGYVRLRMIVKPSSRFAPADPPIDINIYKTIINDTEDFRSLGSLVMPDQRIYRVWGGAIDSQGNIDTTVDAFDRALEAGGGIIEGAEFLDNQYVGGRRYALVDYKRGFAIENVVMQWFLITEGQKSSR